MRIKDAVLQAVYQVARAIFDHIAVEESADGVFTIISKRIETSQSGLDQKVSELLDPHYCGHPITYNHYLIDSVQKAQSGRRR